MTALLLLLATISHASGTSVGNGRVNCREGARDTLMEPGNDTQSTTYSTYTCHQGQWINEAAARAEAVKHATCREGQEEHFPTGSEGSYDTGHVICRHGRFVPYTLNR
ncbi:MAG: hypothetical protein ACXWQO_10930 [Bdellovibrionota bacterium]